MHIFLSSDTTAPYATLLPDESRHCVRVLRMGVGDEVWVTSGDGTMCRARVADPASKTMVTAPSTCTCWWRPPRTRHASSGWWRRPWR